MQMNASNVWGAQILTSQKVNHGLQNVVIFIFNILFVTNVEHANTSRIDGLTLVQP
jgi:hypothetical protein